ncbi:MAG: ATP-binding protein [Clostridiales bacterium]|nr:ATP-binding protein [Clostridiales bacterium]
MKKQFINRLIEKDFLEKEYLQKRSSLVVVYGRRRIGKTALIREFVRNKAGIYFLASEETERENLRAFQLMVAEFASDKLLQKASGLAWDDIFATLIKHKPKEKKIVIIDEFQYLGKSNKAFPSIFQRVWDNVLKEESVMVILCGSLITMMESQVLNYASPLYGRRTGQIKMKQIRFKHYSEFFENKNENELIEYYAVTGGVPKYIELFNEESDIFLAIEKNILNRQSFLYEEPIFLLEREVGEIGTYFSIMKTIAKGNHKLGKIATALEVSQTSLTKYLSGLIELDLLERIVPVTEKNPEKSKKGLYFLKNNFIEFWFKFVYPYRSYIEMDDIEFVLNKIRKNFIDNHVSTVFEDVCMDKMWDLNKQGELGFHFEKLGKWWDKNGEIDIVAINNQTKEITIGECKYTNKKVDVDLFYQLVEKGNKIVWNNENRTMRYILFSKSGYTDILLKLAKRRKDLVLVFNEAK